MNIIYIQIWIHWHSVIIYGGNIVPQFIMVPNSCRSGNSLPPHCNGNEVFSSARWSPVTETSSCGHGTWQELVTPVTPFAVGPRIFMLYDHVHRAWRLSSGAFIAQVGNFGRPRHADLLWAPPKVWPHAAVVLEYIGLIPFAQASGEPLKPPSATIA